MGALEAIRTFKSIVQARATTRRERKELFIMAKQQRIKQRGTHRTTQADRCTTSPAKVKYSVKYLHSWLPEASKRVGVRQRVTYKYQAFNQKGPPGRRSRKNK